MSALKPPEVTLNSVRASTDGVLICVHVTPLESSWPAVVTEVPSSVMPYAPPRPPPTRYWPAEFTSAALADKSNGRRTAPFTTTGRNGMLPLSATECCHLRDSQCTIIMPPDATESCH